jgi:DNA-directed RNA polymerase subunit RPC12/RpoP
MWQGPAMLDYPDTLHALAREGYSIEVTCTWCSHRIEWRPADLESVEDREIRPGEIRCARCGREAVQIGVVPPTYLAERRPTPTPYVVPPKKGKPNWFEMAMRIGERAALEDFKARDAEGYARMAAEVDAEANRA